MRPRWVIAELDVKGEIDAHAAMCLRFAIEDACIAPGAQILVDLRELTTIGAAALELFVSEDERCRASDAQLGILICADTRQQAIVTSFTRAGLGDRLRFSPQPARPPAPPPTVRRRTAGVRWSRRPATAHR
jgi:anti-anti-sigma factor